MGEVYRARDKKLDRDVAIKVLPQSVAADPDTLARFEREAKAVAALSFLQTRANANGSLTAATFKIATLENHGTFDRTGLPDPLVMKQEFTVADGKITELRIGF